MAARAAGAEMLEVLLAGLPEAEACQLINAPDKAGITPVFLAFQRGDEGRSAFQCLLARGAHFNQQELEEEQAAGVLAATIFGRSTAGANGSGQHAL